MIESWEGSREYHAYLSGLKTRSGAKAEYNERAAKKNEECQKGMAEWAPVFVCWPCAGICFEEKEKEGERVGCAASLSCMFYGGLTTIISSTCLKSSTGLAFGIPSLVIGTLCGMGLCARDFGCCQDCCTQDEESASSTADTTANVDAAKVTQPAPSASAISTQPQSSQPATSSSRYERKEAGTAI